MSVLGVGCTAMKTVTPTVDPSKPRFGDLKAGDDLLLHLRDGRRIEITVARVENDALVSEEGVRYLQDDIAELRKRSFSGVKTLGFLGTLYIAAAAALAAAIAILWNT